MTYFILKILARIPAKYLMIYEAIFSLCDAIDDAGFVHRYRYLSVHLLHPC
jgi:hypothetical protein